MPNAMDGEPLFGRAFTAGYLIPDFVVENFCSATGHGVEAGFFHGGHAFFVAEFCLFEDVVILHRCKGLDVQIGTMPAYAAEELRIKLKVVLGHHPPHDMGFCNRLVIVFAYHLHELVHAVLPAFFALFVLAGIRTKGTGIEAHIGRLKVEIAVEVGAIAVALLTQVIGQHGEVGRLGFFVEGEAFFGRNAPAGSDFFGDGAQVGGEALIAQETFCGGSAHKLMVEGQMVLNLDGKMPKIQQTFNTLVRGLLLTLLSGINSQ